MHLARRKRRLRLCMLALATLIPCGCSSMAGIQDMHFSYCNKYRASEAWKCNFSREQRKSLTADFESGFKKGYYDTAMGKDCRLPPLAPPKYWSAKYQSCSGQVAVQEWFRGYSAGISAAQSSACPQFAEVPVAPGAPVLNKTGCGTCYSPDCCNDACNSCQSAAQEISVESWPAAFLDEADLNQQGATIDKPTANAVMPVAFRAESGLIGGYGVQVVEQ